MIARCGRANSNPEPRRRNAKVRTGARKHAGRMERKDLHNMRAGLLSALRIALVDATRTEIEMNQ
jgi:hypothetical protein